MSGKLSMRVLESDLPPHLKQTAAVLALFAKDDGSRIYPSAHRVAWLCGKSERQIRGDLSALRALGVLVPVGPGHGGRGRATRYRLDVTALPVRATWSKPGSGVQGLTARNPEAGCTLSDAKPCSPLPERVQSETETLKSTSENPEVHCTRSVSDQLEDQLEKRAAAVSLSTETADAQDDAPPPHVAFGRARPIALALIDRHPFETKSQFHAAVRQELHDLGADSINEDGVTAAVDMAWLRRRGFRL